MHDTWLKGEAWSVVRVLFSSVFLNHKMPIYAKVIASTGHDVTVILKDQNSDISR